MTKNEAKEILNLCTDIKEEIVDIKNNTKRVYVNREYVLKILDMIDENKVEVNPVYPTNIPGTNPSPYNPWFPQVWYSNGNEPKPHNPTDIYGNPIMYCNTTGQNPEQPIHTFAGSGYGSANCSCIDKSKPTHKYEENVRTSSDYKI